ncbi:MAG: hypothetical protein L6Q33_05990 [Bacteriovoracaceae bacterium]|nr:hypothetical protein [Bacteriovoracaceae bacterium]
MKYGLVLLFFFISLKVVQATQYRPISIGQIIEESEAFVSGVVTNINTEERNGKIWTKVTLTSSSGYLFFGGKIK